LTILDQYNHEKISHYIDASLIESVLLDGKAHVKNVLGFLFPITI